MKRKTALVTGSSEGLGRAILLRLAAEGANVVINYHRNETAAKEVKTAAEAEGVRAIVVQADDVQRARHPSTFPGGLACTALANR